MIGKTVIIIDNGHSYGAYSDAFRAMEFDNEEGDYIKEGTKCTVFASFEHPDDGTIYGLRDKKGNECAMHPDGFEVIEDKPVQYQIGIDTFQRMRSNATKEETLGFIKGNIDKYLWRKKGQDKEDFKKIVDYAKWALEMLD